MKRKPKAGPRPFRDLLLDETSAPSDPNLFLGRFDRGALLSEMEDAGLLRALSERGYPKLVVRTEFLQGEYRLRIRPRGGRVSLVDLRLAEPSAIVEEPLFKARGLGVLSLLAVSWLALQDPRGRFTPERPRLPGQRYPGLGLGKRLYERLMVWAKTWGKDALVNNPQYFHNAVFYASLFRFLSPTRQGRFEALLRDLGSVHVASVSAAVEAGRVVESPGGGVFRWEGGEMAAPQSEGLTAAFSSPEYRELARAARETVHYALNV